MYCICAVSVQLVSELQSAKQSLEDQIKSQRISPDGARYMYNVYNDTCTVQYIIIIQVHVYVEIKSCGYNQLLSSAA